MKLFTSILFLLCFPFFVYSQKQAATLISITSQQGFDHLSENIQNAIQQKAPQIEVVFEDGTYYFDDQNKIVIKNNKMSRITFRAKNLGKARIVAAGEDYSKEQSVGTLGNWYKVKLKKPLDKYCTFQTAEGKAISLGDTGYLNDTLQTNISAAAIEVVDSVKRVARIKLPAELMFMSNKKGGYFANSQLCYKAQWSDCYRDILYSDSQYLYFSLNEWLMKEWKSYVVNMYAWTKVNHKNPPYQPFFVTNVVGKAKIDALCYDDQYLYIPKSIREVHVCRYGEFMRLQGSKAPIIVSGLHFVGTKLAKVIDSWGGRPYATGYGLMQFRNSSNLTVQQCTFSNMGGQALTLVNAHQAIVTGCKFYNNYTDGMVENYGTRNFTFTDNKINNPNKVLTRCMGISLDNTVHALITNNEVANVSRTFVIIGVGDSITISNNLLYTTEKVSRYPVRNFSSDTGVLVYSWGNSPFTVEGNVVHDFPANLHLTGVMVDNGTGHATIRGNLFYNIGDEAIYCWRNRAVAKSNSGNMLESNLILGTVNYGGYNKAATDNAYYQDNIFVRSPRYKVLENSDATDKGGNVWADTFRVNAGRVYLPKTIYHKVAKDKRMGNLLKRYVAVEK